MSGTSGSSSSGKSAVPPRPGGKAPQQVPKRPTGRPSNYAGRPGPGARPAQRASARQSLQQRRQRNIYVASASVGLVVVLVAIFVVAKLAGGGGSSTAPGTYALTPASVDQVEGVSVASMVKQAQAALKIDRTDPSSTATVTPAYKIKGSALTAGGKPEVLYLGAEYCPYCAGERWALVMALSKFGTFSGLRGTTSSSTDVNASTPTFSFYNSTYKSKYLAFVPVEEETNTEAPLQNPTKAQQALVAKWDVYPYVAQGTSGYPIPFVYIDGKYLVTGLQYTASHIAGWQFAQAASYLTSGANPTSQGAEAAAGFLVADLCTLTNDQPASACASVPASLKGVNTASVTSKGSSGTGGTSSSKGNSTPTTSTATSSTTAKSGS